jgi:uncharacterized ferredoxin-like protein
MNVDGNILESEGLYDVAKKICIAARTAPKADGVDNIVISAISEVEIEKLAAEMERIGNENNVSWIVRDANNIRNAGLVILIGTKVKPLYLPCCGFCGFNDCDENLEKGGICAYNSGDLGIAIGSAVSIAADNRVDNRILFSAGKAALNLKMLGEEVKIAYGIPLSVSGKNPFFDRK